MTKSTQQLQADVAAIQAEIKRREAVETAHTAGFPIESQVHGGDVYALSARCLPDQWCKPDASRARMAPRKYAANQFPVENSIPYQNDHP